MIKRFKRMISAVTLVAVTGASVIIASASGGTGGGGTDLLEEAIKLFVKFATIGGGLWGVWGIIVVGTALKDKNGPSLQAGIWQTVGGGMIVAATLLFNSIVI